MLMFTSVSDDAVDGRGTHYLLTEELVSDANRGRHYNVPAGANLWVRLVCATHCCWGDRKY